MSEEIKKFKVGQIYQHRSIGDHNCIWRFEVVKRTKCFVILQPVGRSGFNRSVRCKVRVWRNVETVSPHGRHSFSAPLNADDTKELLADWEK